MKSILTFRKPESSCFCYNTGYTLPEGGSPQHLEEIDMRVCGMMYRAWSRVQPWILVIMAVLPSINSECPSDVQSSTSQCLTDYEAHARAQTDEFDQINFYTGIDAENIRSICKTLFKSMRCVVQIQHSCPKREHSKIITVVEGPLVNVAQLCHYENLYELYSRHQYCFARVKAESNACYNEFTRQTASLTQDLEVPDHHVSQSYCRHFDTFLNCVKNNFRQNCGTEAANLTDQLVKSSIRHSNICSSLKESAQQVTTESHFSKTTVSSGLHDSRVGSTASDLNRRSSLLSALLTLASSLIYLSRS